MIFSKASGVNNSVYGKSQDPIRAFLQQEEEGYKTPIDMIFNVIDSDKYAEKFSELTSKGDFADVGEGGAYPETSQQVGYEKTIEPYEWKSKFVVTQTMIEDAKMYDIKASASNFMISYNRTRDKFASYFLTYGNAATFTFAGKVYNNACRDTGALFANAHTSATGGASQDNLGALVFSYDNLCLVEEYMQKFTDHDGNLLNIQPDTIIIPNNATIKKLVADAVFTEGDGKKPGQTEAGFNFHGSRWNVIVWNQLTKLSASNDPWYN